MPIARRNLTATPSPEELHVLAEITPSDVADARRTWRAHTGDLRELLEAVSSAPPRTPKPQR